MLNCCKMRCHIVSFYLQIISYVGAFYPQALRNRQMATCSRTQSVVQGIEDIVLQGKYDIYLLDMWGVMHDGSKPYDGVLDTIQKLKEAGKEMIILSNSSKRQGNSNHMLTKLGFNPHDFAHVITSGEVSYRMLAGDESLKCETWSVLKEIRARNVLVFGSGSEDEAYCTSAGWSLSSVEEATLILARGTFTICDGVSAINKNDDEAKYNRILYETLKTAARRKIPMLVTNPDKVRPDEGLPPMPGAIGDMYANLLDSSDEAQRLLKRIGKPFQEVYDLALHGKDKVRACMIGDALETDVTGGQKYGIDTVWIVKDGIHGPDVIGKGNKFEDGANSILSDFNSQAKGTYAGSQKLSPTYTLKHFRW